MNADIMAKMKAFSVSRQGPPTPGGNRPAPPPQQSNPNMAGAFPAGFKLPPQLQRPQPQMASSSPAVPGAKGPAKGMSLAEKRGMKMPGGLPGASPTSPAPAPGGRQKPKMTLSQMGGAQPNGEGSSTQAAPEPPKQQSEMEKYAEYIDTKTGALNFKGKATVHGGGIDFKDGRSFNISLDEVDTLDELGKGNYGTVYKVRHARPRFRKAGQGLAGNKARGPLTDEDSQSPAKGGTTGKTMAMKEIRLELDDLKFAQIIMELDILHKCISPYIVDFYGAFFQEGAVYICLEFMDGGSIDRLYGDGIPENVLRKITFNTVMGLKFLKEEHNIIHRDVKPTNILVNQRGQVKICDFGVSGNLVASIAKTNIGCQSYMAPERISSGGMASAGAVGGTYNVQSDIWSLGLTLIECAMGRYPYPPETYDNIFSQLSVSPSSISPSPKPAFESPASLTRTPARPSSTAPRPTSPPTPSPRPRATSSPAASTKSPTSAPRTPCCCSTRGWRRWSSPRRSSRRTRRRPRTATCPPPLRPRWRRRRRRTASWIGKSASGSSTPWIGGGGASWARRPSPRCTPRRWMPSGVPLLLLLPGKRWSRWLWMLDGWAVEFVGATSRVRRRVAEADGPCGRTAAGSVGLGGRAVGVVF